LTAALQSAPEQAIRERAAWALGQIGPKAKSAIPALRDAAGTKQPRLSRLANEALAAIGG
jgi:HEAT repeat protein